MDINCKQFKLYFKKATQNTNFKLGAGIFYNEIALTKKPAAGSRD